MSYTLSIVGGWSDDNLETDFPEVHSFFEDESSYKIHSVPVELDITSIKSNEYDFELFQHELATVLPKKTINCVNQIMLCATESEFYHAKDKVFTYALLSSIPSIGENDIQYPYILIKKIPLTLKTLEILRNSKNHQNNHQIINLSSQSDSESLIEGTESL